MATEGRKRSGHDPGRARREWRKLLERLEIPAQHSARRCVGRPDDQGIGNPRRCTLRANSLLLAANRWSVRVQAGRFEI
jgi:hypothetical protein